MQISSVNLQVADVNLKVKSINLKAMIVNLKATSVKFQFTSANFQVARLVKPQCNEHSGQNHETKCSHQPLRNETKW